MEYTKLGPGDFTQDYPEDTRPQCNHCNERFTPASGEADDYYCSYRCWYLSNIGEYKAQILCWITQMYDAKKIISAMEAYAWFDSISEASVSRWKRAIKNLDVAV